MMARSTGVYGRGNRRRVTPYGKWSDTARVNLDLHRFRAALYVITGSSKDNVLTGEEGAEIVIGFSRDGELMYLNLSSLTHAQLTAFKEFIDIAFANAQDIVLLRDAVAKEALENGDDSYARVYRTIPEIIVREGEKWADYPRIRRGFEWIAHLVPEFRTRVQNVRGTGKSIPEPGPEDAGPEDNQSETRNVS